MDFALTEEQQMVRDMARRFSETEIKPRAADLDEKHEHPAEIVKQLGELKFKVPKVKVSLRSFCFIK